MHLRSMPPSYLYVQKLLEVACGSRACASGPNITYVSSPGDDILRHNGYGEGGWRIEGGRRREDRAGMRDDVGRQHLGWRTEGGREGMETRGWRVDDGRRTITSTGGGRGMTNKIAGRADDRGR
eukprot:9489049-Pyramimonas_sp.AAC.1